MPSRRIDSLRALCDLTRGAGVGSVRLTLDELEGLLAVVEATRAVSTIVNMPALLAVVEAARNLSGASSLSHDDCMCTVHMDYVDLLDIAIAKLDEVQP